MVLGVERWQIVQSLWCKIIFQYCFCINKIFFRSYLKKKHWTFLKMFSFEYESQKSDISFHFVTETIHHITISRPYNLYSWPAMAFIWYFLILLKVYNWNNGKEMERNLVQFSKMFSTFTISPRKSEQQTNDMKLIIFFFLWLDSSSEIFMKNFWNLMQNFQ